MSIRHQRFDDSATILFGALTSNYQNLLALSDDVEIIFIFNTMNVPILLSMPSGYAGTPPSVVYKNIRLPATSSMAIDCRTNSKRIATGTIQVKFANTAPNSGEVTITVAR